jgi:hypothetical protein
MSVVCEVQFGNLMLFLEVIVYYESIKREPKIRGIKKCRCDERLVLFLVLIFLIFFFWKKWWISEFNAA